MYIAEIFAHKFILLLSVKDNLIYLNFLSLQKFFFACIVPLTELFFILPLPFFYSQKDGRPSKLETAATEHNFFYFFCVGLFSVLDLSSV